MARPAATTGAKGFNRRQLLAGATAVAGSGVVVGFGADIAQSEPAEWVGGTVERIDNAATFTLRRADRPGAPAVTVKLTQGASVLRDHPAALADFVLGDEVAVLGAFDVPGEFIASRLEATYRIVEATIATREAGELSTDGGELRLRSEAHAEGGQALGHRVEARAIDKLRPGDHIIATGRRVPTSGDLLVSQIGVAVG